MFESLASCFTLSAALRSIRHRRIRLRRHQPFVKKKGPPPDSRRGPFIELPELSGHCHAASARAAGATSAAPLITGRHRCRGGNRHKCCNQEQIFHNSLLLRFREVSAAHMRTKYGNVCAEPNAKREIKPAGGESVVVRFVHTRLRRRLQKSVR